MKRSVITMIGAFLVASCQKDNVLPDDSKNTEAATPGVYSFSNAYWYSGEMFEGSVIYIGSLTIADKKPTHRGEVKTSYRISITEIIKRSAEVVPHYSVGDVIQSTTLRAVVDGADHVMCFSRYPEGDDGDTVTDGGFPLHIDGEVTRAIQVIRSSGFDPESYKEEDYRLIRDFLRNPEMYDHLRKNKKGANKSLHPTANRLGVDGVVTI